MADKIRNVLFLCTANSARSILAEALLNCLGKGRFRAYSAGSFPRGSVNPFALALLHGCGYPIDRLRSKSWNEFATPDAPKMDFVITVCDNAAGEVCPVWPGGPLSAHWGIADPAAVEGTDADKRAAFRAAAEALESRIRQFLALSIGTLEPAALRATLAKIGQGP
jgi:arsenate reductase